MNPSATQPLEKPVMLSPASSSADFLGKRRGHWRPQVHFTTCQGWLNDPNGLFKDSRGIWHLYYQYDEAVAGNKPKSWGHATSTNLYNWTDQPVAIHASTKEGEIWSGCAVLDTENISGFFGPSSKDNILAYFTSMTEKEERQHLAYSMDGGISFTSYKKNPIISLSRRGFRDPKVVYHAETSTWAMVITMENSVAFYASSNLVDWVETSRWTPEPQVGYIECPQLVKIPMRDGSGVFLKTIYVLVISIGNGRLGTGRGSIVRYLPGCFDGKIFTPFPVPSKSVQGSNHWMQDYDFGPDVYATAFWHVQDAADTDNVFAISWAINVSYAQKTPTEPEGWRHCMTVVREHWLDDRYRLISRPVYGSKDHDGDVEVTTTNSASTREIKQAHEVSESNSAFEFNMVVHYDHDTSATGAHGVRIAFMNAESHESLEVVVDIDNSGEYATVELVRHSMLGWTGEAPVNVWQSPILTPVSGCNDGRKVYKVRGIVDRSILEVYLNDGQHTGTMVFYARSVLDRMTLTSDGAKCNLSRRWLRAACNQQ